MTQTATTLALLPLLLLLPSAAASHAYEPDYPAYCAQPSDSPPSGGGPGSYTCTGAVYTRCGGIDYPYPCKVCQGYTYTYDHDIDGNPEETHAYSHCTSIHI